MGASSRGADPPSPQGLAQRGRVWDGPGGGWSTLAFSPFHFKVATGFKLDFSVTKDANADTNTTANTPLPRRTNFLRLFYLFTFR